MAGANPLIIISSQNELWDEKQIKRRFFQFCKVYLIYSVGSVLICSIKNNNVK